MLGWFKKKFSKNKKQETSSEQESVPQQEKIVLPEDVDSTSRQPVTQSDEKFTVKEENSPLVDGGPVEEEEKISKDTLPPAIPAEDIPADSEAVPVPEELIPSREDGAKLPSSDISNSPGTIVELGEEEEFGLEVDGLFTETTESPSVVKAEEEAEQDTSAGILEQADFESTEASIDEGEDVEIAGEQGDNLSEAALDENFAALLQDDEAAAPEKEASNDEPVLDIVDQTLEELLAPEQPEEEGCSLEQEIPEEQGDIFGHEDAVVAEAALPAKDYLPEESAGDDETTIIDQPLEELLASEQPEDGQDISGEGKIDGQQGVGGAEDGEGQSTVGEEAHVEEEVDVVEDENGPEGDPKTLFQRLQERLGKTRQGLLYRLDSIFLGKKEIDEELLDELEEILITSDLGVATTMDLLDAARRQVKRKELSDPQALKKILRDRILGFLLASDQPAELVMPESGPFVIMVVGVNGVGKTTTIGKIANKFKQSGQSVLLIAADTFRAAAIDQLKIWAERVGTDIVAHKPGADPSSVVFDGLDYGVRNNFDAIIIDTAGRLHTSVNLMEELKKIRRVIGKKMEGAPHEVLLILDATTGQNGISQAKLFGEAVGVSGIALTKLDGTAKGGIVANVCRELKIPVRFIGIGEQMDDLRDFDAQEFVDALFAEESSETVGVSAT